MLTMHDTPPRRARQRLGCGGTLAIFTVGLAAVLIPLLATFDNESRAQALRSFSLGLAPGAAVGLIGAIRRRLREREAGMSGRTATGAMWPLALVGYAAARFFPPGLMGAMAGFGSGVAIAFSVTWAVTFSLEPHEVDS